MIFSSFGNDPRSALPGQFPGQNQNGLSPAVLKALKELASKNASSTTYTRDCDASRFINQNNSFLNVLATTTRLVDAENTAAIDNYFEATRCSPDGQRIVEKLILTCQVLGSNDGVPVNIQAIFRVPFSSQFEASPVFGNPTAPAGATVFTVELGGNVDRLVFYHGNLRTWWALRTYDNMNNLLQTALCGTVITVTDLDNATIAPPKLSIQVNELVGIYGGRLAALPATAPLTYFGFTKYV
jgi:hypothetical protein